MAESTEMLGPFRVHRGAPIVPLRPSLSPKIVGTIFVWDHGEAHRLNLTPIVDKEELVLVFKGTEPFAVRVFSDFVNVITGERMGNRAANIRQDYLVILPNEESGHIAVGASNLASYNLQIEVIPQKILRTEVGISRFNHAPYKINGRIFTTEMDSNLCRSFLLPKGSMTPVIEFLDMVAFRCGLLIGEFNLARKDTDTGGYSSWMEPGRCLGDYDVQVHDMIEIIANHEKRSQNIQGVHSNGKHNAHAQFSADTQPSGSWDLENSSMINLKLIPAAAFEDTATMLPPLRIAWANDGKPHLKRTAVDDGESQVLALTNFYDSTNPRSRPCAIGKAKAAPSVHSRELKSQDSYKSLVSRISFTEEDRKAFNPDSYVERPKSPFKSPTKRFVIPAEPYKSLVNLVVKSTDYEESKQGGDQDVPGAPYKIINWFQIKGATTFRPLVWIQEDFEAKEQHHDMNTSLEKSLVGVAAGPSSTPASTVSNLRRTATPSKRLEYLPASSSSLSPEKNTGQIPFPARTPLKMSGRSDRHETRSAEKNTGQTPIPPRTPLKMSGRSDRYETRSAEKNTGQTPIPARTPVTPRTPRRPQTPTSRPITAWDALNGMSPSHEANAAWRLRVTPSSTTALTAFVLLPVKPIIESRREQAAISPTRAPAASAPIVPVMESMIDADVQPMVPMMGPMIDAGVQTSVPVMESMIDAGVQTSVPIIESMIDAGVQRMNLDDMDVYHTFH